jgi:hypothetical protein
MFGCNTEINNNGGLAPMPTCTNASGTCKWLKH